MASDWETKQDDTWPNLDVTLTINGTGINLTTATSVTFLAEPTGGGTTVVRPCTVTNAALGELTVDWQAGDTALAGTYKVEFEIIWSNGDIGTIPKNGYKSMEIFADLN